MRKFEYRVVELRWDLTPEEDWLNKQGKKGWQLTGVSVDNHNKQTVFYMMREINQEPLHTELMTDDSKP